MEGSTWNKDSSISEAQAIDAAANGAVRWMKLIRTAGGFYVQMALTWRHGKLHLVTQRDPSRPRVFKDMSRLFAYVESKFPTMRRLVIVLKP